MVEKRTCMHVCMCVHECMCVNLLARHLLESNSACHLCLSWNVKFALCDLSISWYVSPYRPQISILQTVSSAPIWTNTWKKIIQYIWQQPHFGCALWQQIVLWHYVTHQQLYQLMELHSTSWLRKLRALQSNDVKDIWDHDNEQK